MITRFLFILLLTAGVFMALIFFWHLFKRIFNKNKAFEDKDVIFYKGEYWAIVGLFHDAAGSFYSIIGTSGSNKDEILSVPELYLIKHAVKQQYKLEVEMKSEAMEEIYSEEKELKAKYGKKK